MFGAWTKRKILKLKPGIYVQAKQVQSEKKSEKEESKEWKQIPKDRYPESQSFL